MNGTNIAVLAPFIRFGSVLRAHGFPAAPEQTAGFLSAISLLGPRGTPDVLRAAHALFGPPPERHAEFEALFRAHFLGEVALDKGETDASEDEPGRARDAARFGAQPEAAEAANEAGSAATRAEILSPRRLAAGDDAMLLRRFVRSAPVRLPRRRGSRFIVRPQGRTIDLRRSLRDLVHNDGDVARLVRRARKPRLRKLLLLIDVSGSMKQGTDAHLRFAHALSRAAEQVEVFTFGTRLTRVTHAMRYKDRALALAEASDLVADWSGGTRIGEAFATFLAIPRFAGYARGALVLMVSDGLERGGPGLMLSSVRRLKQLAWRVAWLSPLALGPDYRIETEALKAILPFIDDFAAGGSTQSLCDYMLNRSARMR